MQTTKGLRSTVAAMMLFAASFFSLNTAQSMTVPVNTPFFGGSDQIFDNGDFAGYGVILSAGDTSFYIEFQVSSSGAINFASGAEGAGQADVDISNVALINTMTNTEVGSVGGPLILSEGNGKDTPSFPGGLHSDAFFASFAGLVSGTTYRLLVNVDVFDTSGTWFGGATDLFAGQISFNVVPVPPALLLFATGLLGMGLLSRRRRQGLPSA